MVPSTTELAIINTTRVDPRAAKQQQSRDTVSNNEKLENEETMENKIAYQNTSIVISLREKLCM